MGWSIFIVFERSNVFFQKANRGRGWRERRRWRHDEEKFNGPSNGVNRLEIYNWIFLYFICNAEAWNREIKWIFDLRNGRTRHFQMLLFNLILIFAAYALNKIKDVMLAPTLFCLLFLSFNFLFLIFLHSFFSFLFG